MSEIHNTELNTEDKRKEKIDDRLYKSETNENLIEEKFRVDRKKLEQLIEGIMNFLIKSVYLGLLRHIGFVELHILSTL